MCGQSEKITDFSLKKLWSQKGSTPISEKRDDRLASLLYDCHFLIHFYFEFYFYFILFYFIFIFLSLQIPPIYLKDQPQFLLRQCVYQQKSLLLHILFFCLFLLPILFFCLFLLPILFFYLFPQLRNLFLYQSNSEIPILLVYVIKTSTQLCAILSVVENKNNNINKKKKQNKTKKSELWKK